MTTISPDLRPSSWPVRPEASHAAVQDYHNEFLAALEGVLERVARLETLLAEPEPKCASHFGDPLRECEKNPSLLEDMSSKLQLVWERQQVTESSLQSLRDMLQVHGKPKCYESYDGGDHDLHAKVARLETLLVCQPPPSLQPAMDNVISELLESSKHEPSPEMSTERALNALLQTMQPSAEAHADQTSSCAQHLQDEFHNVAEEQDGNDYTPGSLMEIQSASDDEHGHSSVEPGEDSFVSELPSWVVIGRELSWLWVWPVLISEIDYNERVVVAVFKSDKTVCRRVSFAALGEQDCPLKNIDAQDDDDT